MKNIIGDNRKRPSRILLDSMKKLIDKYPKRTDDNTILNNVAKDGIGLTVFISDLEDACQSGNPEEMENAAAKIQWVSENGLGVLEVLIEVAIQDFSRLGILSYHLQRAHHITYVRFHGNVYSTIISMQHLMLRKHLVRNQQAILTILYQARRRRR